MSTSGLLIFKILKLAKLAQTLRVNNVWMAKPLDLTRFEESSL